MTKNKKDWTLYLAGGLFNAGQRLHIMYLERALKELGYDVIVPQREAVKHQKEDGTFDVKGIVKECFETAGSTGMVTGDLLVGCLDGADADSGTSVEYGAAMKSAGVCVVYRTDFRTNLEKEVGVNAMFGVEGTRFIYEPFYLTELDEVEVYYNTLAKKIDLICQSIVRFPLSSLEDEEDRE